MTTPLYISFGYRCTSAGLLKRMGLKTESHPFDWMVSRLSVIQDCISTNFAHFLHANYTCRPTITASYEPHESEMDVHVCDESVWLNEKYSFLPPSPEHTSKYWRIFGRDTYSYPMAFNHHNMLLPETREYFVRCIERLRDALHNRQIHYLYIHPIQDVGEHTDNVSQLMDDFSRFHGFISGESKSPPTGLFILPVRTQHPYPITDYYKSPVKTLVKTADGMTIVVLYCNRDIVDAGEIWYRNGFIEEELAIQCIREIL